MDPVGLGIQLEGPDWEVYRDALAPSQPSRITKAWERAPVPAYAPRLQGQKIWKKAGLRREGKENDITQLELDLEGKGARKRVRMTGAKENIGQARWMEDISSRDTAAENAGETNEGNEIREESALQFIPRKRTNTNRLITPRKPLRQTTLNGQAQTQPLAGSPGSVAEKSARKRKSMRKSIRKSIVPALIEPTAVSVVENTKNAAIVPQLEQPTNLPEPTEHSPEQPKAENAEPVTVETAEEAPTLPRTEINAEHIKIPLNDEAEQVQESLSSVTPFTQAEQEVNVKAKPSRRKSTRSIRKSTATPRKQIPLPTATDSFEPTPRSTEHEHQEQSLVKHFVDEQFELPSSTYTETVKIPLNDHKSKTHAVGETDKSASLLSSEAHPILESVEVDLEVDANRPVKPSGSPRKRRASSVRRGTRRSTRTIRASSTKAEEQPSQGTSALGAVEQQNTASSSETFELPSSDEVAQTREAAPSPSVVASIFEVPVPGLQTELGPTGAVETTNEESLVGKDIQQPDHELPMHEEVEQSDIEKFQNTQPAENPENPDSLPEVVPSPIIQPGESPDPAIHISSPVKKIAVLIESLSPASEPEVVEANVPEDDASDSSSPEQFSPVTKNDLTLSNLEDATVEDLEVLEPVFVEDETLTISAPNDPTEEIPESSTPNPSTSELVEAISENAPSIAYDHDDTDMLRNFLTRVKANKAAKAEKTIPKRKRSLPHSPLRLPLGEADPNMSPSPQKSKDEKDEFDISLPTTSPTNCRKRKESIVDDEDVTEPKSIRRSGRTRLPVVKAPLGAPSFIPVRRLNQDGDTTVTLRRSEEKELAALTRVNTRKNKAGALSAAEVLVKKAEEKDDPALRQRLLKEVFDEKAKKGKEKAKTVAWAEELARYQEAGEKKVVLEQTEKEKDKEKGVDEKKSAVRVGMRSKIALGMAVNGTPAPKRRTRERL